MPSRRRFLSVLGATSSVISGCTTMADDPPKSGSMQSINPGKHVFGATGEWSSFGCNASNTRGVADGKAPVDGVTERWRVEVPQIAYHEPLVADGHVYQPTPRELRVYDAADGSELWTRANVKTTPLVRGDLVYAGVSNRLLALDSKTGETKWEKTLGENGFVRTPSMYDPEWLYVPAGETIHRVSSFTGEVEWSRRLLGNLLGSPAIYLGYYVAVATEAGKLYLLSPDGTGAGEWNLPSKPQTSPTADTEGVYVNCLDGNTYGITLENQPRLNIDWKAETGWASGGLAVKKHLYASGTGGLHAIDPDDGEQVWKYDTGDWRWTAPALGRDTLFVGGDKLYAFDPTPSLRIPGTGPAKRFERSFHGRVGPGPVLDDGVLYVVAQTGRRKFHLLAFE
ncbi:outer membrane protein assembly factor BamB family protein [Haladaptatus sp. NG-SE-30]